MQPEPETQLSQLALAETIADRLAVKLRGLVIGELDMAIRPTLIPGRVAVFGLDMLTNDHLPSLSMQLTVTGEGILVELKVQHVYRVARFTLPYSGRTAFPSERKR